jgi:integrase
MRKAQAAWGQRNVKTIQYGEFEDFLASLNHLSSKTRHNVRSALSQFFAWLSKRENIKPPEIPKVKFELGWREIIDLETQTAILDHLHKIAPLKVYVGVRWLATYVAIRPNEMRCLRERDINVNGFFVIPSPKEKKPKLVPMLPEDIKLYESFPSGFPHLFFFRHEKGNGGAKPGDQFSREMFRRWWNQACQDLGIKDVDCYGGTRHSTASAIGQYFTKEEMRDHGTMHATNKAFERYMQHETAPSLKIYEMARKMRGGES